MCDVFLKKGEIMRKRSYKQNCAVAHALDIIGDRWSILIVRELLTGPKRFKNLLQSLRGMGTNLLTNRLKEMERDGLIIKTQLPPPAEIGVYELTECGKDLEPVLIELIKWKLKLKSRDREEYLSMAHWDMLAMKAVFRGKEKGAFKGVVQFHVDTTYYYVDIKNELIDVAVGKIENFTLFIRGDRPSVLRIGDPTISLVDLRDVLVTGSFELFTQFVSLFRPTENEK